MTSFQVNEVLLYTNCHLGHIQVSLTLQRYSHFRGLEYWNMQAISNYQSYVIYLHQLSLKFQLFELGNIVLHSGVLSYVPY